MIECLKIRDLALIADMELEFSSGINALTGETGAGKSFILKAIDFILGEKLGAEMIRPGKDRAQVEASFSVKEEKLIIRRELYTSGRSRLYINDRLRSQDYVRELRPKLVLHTSQHGQQRLTHPAQQMELLDAWMNRQDLLQEKKNILRDLNAIEEKRNALIVRSRELSERRELLELHLKEIQKVNPLPGEEEELEQRRKALKTVFQRIAQYERTLIALEGDRDSQGVLPQLIQLERHLENLTEIDEDLSPYLQAVSTARESLAELSQRLRCPPSIDGNIDPDAIESRLYELSQLKRNLHCSLPEILALRDELQDNLSFLDVCGLERKQIERDKDQILQKLKVILKKINTSRHEAALVFCARLEHELRGLGFSQEVRIVPVFSPHAWAEGCVEDKMTFLWAPNPGQPPQPLDRIASGGELSRFLLAVTSLQAANEETLIFDEVDAGIGGITLNRVGDKLAELAEKRQLILITHWPQLAARASRHFQVSKRVVAGETFTSCIPLTNIQRDAELKRMSGVEVG